MKTKTKKEKPNQLEKLAFNITAPFKMDNEIELKELSVFVGANSSGKSFILKVAYALGAVGIMHGAPPDPKGAAQFIFDNTFIEQKFNGVFKSVYTHGLVSVELKDGKVIQVDVQGQVKPVTFMSSNMRLFSSMVLYLQLRKKASGSTLDFMKTMLESYRLYDFTYMEALLTRLPAVLPDNAKDYLSSMGFPDPIASIEVDTDKCEFVAVLKDGSKRNISAYGHGHQAILNMMLGTLAN